MTLTQSESALITVYAAIFFVSMVIHEYALERVFLVSLSWFNMAAIERPVKGPPSVVKAYPTLDGLSTLVTLSQARNSAFNFDIFFTVLVLNYCY
jgi:hypothetical protein